MRAALRSLAILGGLLVSGCDNGPAAPSDGVTRPTIQFGAVAPAPGATIVTEGTPPGAFIQRGSGALVVNLTVWSGRELPWARLNLYLLTGDGSTYCGQNLPDSPTWQPFARGDRAQFAITGFQVHQVPCNVTGLRAMLHSRPGGAAEPPLAHETLADDTFPIAFRIE